MWESGACEGAVPVGAEAAKALARGPHSRVARGWRKARIHSLSGARGANRRWMEEAGLPPRPQRAAPSSRSLWRRQEPCRTRSCSAGQLRFIVATLIPRN